MNTLVAWFLNNPWVALSALIAFTLYVPLCRAILSKDPEKCVEQNIASWVLWGLLDVIALVGILSDKGNYLLVATYTLGAVITSTCILLSPSKIQWTWVETLSVVLVITCLILWKNFGSTLAIISSSAAVFVASIPQMVSAWKKPDKKSGLIYAGYSLANILSVIGGKNWSAEERCYPSFAAVACLIVTFFYFRTDRVQTVIMRTV